MINSTNTLNIDGSVLRDEEFLKAFTFNDNDRFSHWVVRPLAVITTIGVGLAMFFASAFLILLSLAILPLLALSFWAVKTKLERDLAKSDPVVNTQSAGAEETDADVQTTR